MISDRPSIDLPPRSCVTHESRAPAVERDHDAAAVRPPGSVAKIETGHAAIVVSSPTVMRLASHEVAGGCYGGTYVRHQMPRRVIHGYTDGDQAHGGDKQPIVSHNALPSHRQPGERIIPPDLWRGNGLIGDRRLAICPLRDHPSRARRHTRRQTGRYLPCATTFLSN